MPTLKINAKAREHKTGFEGYAGPEPDRPGAYRAVVKRLRWREFGTGSQGFVALVELAASADTPDKAKYDGAPYWTNVVAVPKPGEAMKDGSIRSVETFLAALNVSDDPAIAWEDGDVKRGVDLTKLGGKSVTNLLDTVVVVDLTTDTSGRGNALQVSNLRPSGEGRSTSAPVAQDEWAVEPDEEDEEPGEEESWDRDARKKELTAMRLPALRRFAEDDYDLTTTGLNKVELVNLVLDHEEPSEDDEEPSMALADEPEEDEPDEEEDDDSAAYDARKAELDAMDRPALKAALKGVDPERKVFKSTSDDDLRTWILESEFSVEDEDDEPTDPPF